MFSSGVKVTVVPDPTIDTQPVGGTICTGGNFNLSVQASNGTPSLTYQWQSSSDNISFSNIPGATSVSYTTPALSSTTYYKVIITQTGNNLSSAMEFVHPVVLPFFVDV